MPTQPQKLITPEKFLNTILEEAVRDRASDVHIEPLADGMRVRYRIDGSLRERHRRPLLELEPLVTRVKAISDLDIATRLPQDGHFEFQIELSESGRTSSAKEASNGEAGMYAPPSRLANALSSLFGEEGGKPESGPRKDATSNKKESARETIGGTSRPAGLYVLNVRVSVFPTVYGEAAVFRLLNRGDMLIPLNELGMEADDLATMHSLMSSGYGMLLTTGPSGSGKTTTLYSIIQELKDKEKNIITLEDPVEFYFGDIRQTQIRPEQGLTYAIGMRSILRQDPDVIMVGEIRDEETAEHAMRASLVGRIVGSTIHASTPIGTIVRLMDMNIERGLIAYAIRGIVAQRLLRKICNACAVPYTPDATLLERLGITKQASQYQFRKGNGCDVCGGTGFNGRTGIYEVLVITDDLRSLIVERASLRELQDYIKKSGVVTLRERAIQKVLEGVTTVEEAVLVV